MEKELYNQSLEMFDTAEKWIAFTDLAKQKDNFRNTYLNRAAQALFKYFTSNPVEGWTCEVWHNNVIDLRWYLTDFGKDSLALGVVWNYHFTLHLMNKLRFDTNKVDALLKTEYSLIMSSFDRVDRQFEPEIKVMENRNYVFGDPCDSNFENEYIDRLAWYAGNQTEKFVSQIINKVERFTKNEKLTKMLYEINKRSEIVLQDKTETTVVASL